MDGIRNVGVSSTDRPGGFGGRLQGLYLLSDIGELGGNGFFDKLDFTLNKVSKVLLGGVAISTDEEFQSFGTGLAASGIAGCTFQPCLALLRGREFQTSYAGRHFNLGLGLPKKFCSSKMECRSPASKRSVE